MLVSAANPCVVVSVLARPPGIAQHESLAAKHRRKKHKDVLFHLLCREIGELDLVHGSTLPAKAGTHTGREHRYSLCAAVCDERHVRHIRRELAPLSALRIERERDFISARANARIVARFVRVTKWRRRGRSLEARRRIPPWQDESPDPALA